MGEILKKMCTLKGGLIVELNAPQGDGKDYVIHIQNDNGRLSLSRNEFIQLAMLFHCANHNLKSYKVLSEVQKKQ